MIPYLLIYLYLFTGYLFQHKKTSKYFFLNINVAMVVLFLFSSLRGNGSGDYFNYINAASRIQSFKDFQYDYNYDLGFKILSLIGNKLNFHPQWVIISMNILSLGSIFYVINKESSDKWLSLLIYYPIMLLFDMHHSRSAISINMGVLFIYFIYKREIFRAILSFLVAFSFHKSAIILLLLPMLINDSFIDIYSKTFFRIKNRVVFIVVLLIISLLKPLQILILLISKIEISLFQKIVSYIQSDWSYPFMYTDPRLWMVILIFIVHTPLVTSISTQKDNDTFKKTTFLDETLLMIIISMLMLRESTILVIRMSHFFMVYLVFIFPELWKYYKMNSYYVSVKNRLKDTNLSLYMMLIVQLIYTVYTLGIINWQVEYYLFSYY